MFLFCSHGASVFRQTAVPAALGLALFVISAAPGKSQTACVQCTGPETIYACEAVSDEKLSDRAVGFYCASRLARENQHRSCAVQRSATSCLGTPVRLFHEDESHVIPSRETPPDQAAVQRDQKPREPETLGEFAKDTADASSRALQNAGETIGEAANKAGAATSDALEDAGSAIGDATKKTLKCLGSALNDC